MQIRILPFYLTASLFLMFSACGTEEPEVNNGEVTMVTLGDAPKAYLALEDNIKHDTLLIQTTFDLGDSTFVMVAGNVEPTFEGIRLYRYTLLPDSAARIIAASSPGYDSWTMLPSFFSLANDPNTHIITANFGERESWGQKLFKLDGSFHDLGFMDIALPERVEEDGSLQLKRRNIGPLTRMAELGDTLIFNYACDSVYLYDDQAGHNDIVLPASAVQFTYHPNTGLEIRINGQRRAVKQPG